MRVTDFLRAAGIGAATEAGTGDETETAAETKMTTETDSAADFETAAVRERVAAYLADGVVVGGAVVGGTVVGVARRFGDSRRERVRLVGLLGLVIANLYHVLLEGTGGQTVGKRVVGIAVVSEDGRRCSYAAATIRTAFRFVDWLPVGYLLGFLSIGLTEQRQRVGDLAADTVVVRTDGDAGGGDG